MTSSVDIIHYQDLAQKDPETVCRRSGCHFDADANNYSLSVWQDEYAVFPEAHRIVPAHGQNNVRQDYLELFIIHHLLSTREIELRNQWISEKDIPGGTTFFRGPHAIPTHLISNRFQNDIEDFDKRCKQLHGIPLDMADSAWRFNITTRIPIAVLYWQGDDEFMPESKLLYDQTIYDHLASDIIYAIAVYVCTRLAGGTEGA